MKNVALTHKKYSDNYLSIKDLLDITCFAINKKITAYAISSQSFYTLIRNIPEEMMKDAIRTHHSINVRNLQQLEEIQTSLNIKQIVLSSNSNKLSKLKTNLPNWIKDRFSIIIKENKILILPN